MISHDAMMALGRELDDKINGDGSAAEARLGFALVVFPLANPTAAECCANAAPAQVVKALGTLFNGRQEVWGHRALTDAPVRG